MVGGQLELPLALSGLMNDEGYSRCAAVLGSLLAAGGYSSTLASLASAAGGWRLGMSFLT